MKPVQETEAISRIIRFAWEDRTTFEEIKERTGPSETEVVVIMRCALKAFSFRRWRKRVSGRITKHRNLTERHLQATATKSKRSKNRRQAEGCSKASRDQAGATTPLQPLRPRWRFGSSGEESARGMKE